MDRTILVMFPLNAGRKLIAALDNIHFDVQAAFWLYRPEAEDWWLYIASPLYDQAGPLVAYKRIQSVSPSVDLSQDAPFNELSLNNIAVVSPRNPLVRALRKAIHVEPGEPMQRLHGITKDNVTIGEAFIYRML